jgi:Asp-tRNA(Asn)/Glu-tRNA(Gln) amidotransferase C subunit
MDFLWHQMSEKEKEEVKKQVDSIIDSFSKKLSTIGGKIEEEFIELEKFEREEEGEPLEISKRIIFENAPESNKDFIIAEKKKW